MSVFFKIFFFFDTIYNKKDKCYTLGGFPVAAERCRTYAPTDVEKIIK